METQQAIKVLVVDDHTLFHQGIATALRLFDNLQIMAGARNGLEAVQCCNDFPVDVVLMDIVMPEMDGIDAIRQIKAAKPHISIIILTGALEEGHVKAALEAGAVSFLLKNVSLVELAHTIQDAAIGRSRLSPEVVDTLVRISQPAQSSMAALSPREHDILDLLILGLSNEGIGQKLGISTATAKIHVRHIIAKLGALNRTDVVAIALRNRPESALSR